MNGGECLIRYPRKGEKQLAMRRQRWTMMGETMGGTKNKPGGELVLSSAPFSEDAVGGSAVRRQSLGRKYRRQVFLRYHTNQIGSVAYYLFEHNRHNNRDAIPVPQDHRSPTRPSDKTERTRKLSSNAVRWRRWANL